MKSLTDLYSVENFRSTGHALVDQLADYLESTPSADAHTHDAGALRSAGPETGCRSNLDTRAPNRQGACRGVIDRVTGEAYQSDASTDLPRRT